MENNNIYPMSKQTESAVGSIIMYLYQAYTEEQGLSQEQAKAKVIAKLEEGIIKFKGNDSKEEVKEKTNSVGINNTLAIKEIRSSLDGLKQNGNYKSRSIKYLVDTIDFNFNKLVESNKLK